MKRLCHWNTQPTARMGKKGILLEQATPFSLLGMQQFSAGLVLPPRDTLLLQLLSCLSFIYATTCQASPHLSTLLAGCSPHLPAPRQPRPVQSPPAPHSSTCASSRTALSMAQGPLGCPSAVTGPQPSLQSGLAGHHTNQQGLLKAFCSQQTHLV